MASSRKTPAGSEIRPLDRIDRQILDILQKEGRIPISELAGRVNLSTTPCSERVKRLEREGIIMGYHARVNPQAVGKDLLVFLETNLSAKSGDVFEKVRRELMEVPEVLECHLVSGEFDYLVKARLGEMRAYRRLLGELLKRLPASASSRSYVVMEEVKETLYLAL
ncbi:Leucine-responsive regulatory protein, regulator for leucine (or lrp) regulon and high-affinity branched-chain amino acid transport system [plant metagenome]|uniref:Leucine-responsive regulatory protein, regulator for leucine (Or lrp) regulon and high-affinity branched-chain amino acid transport system n=1 Tax=plant metagenome TaxID=1297885 RepID=A0A484PBF7_9ZZZZ